MLSSFTDCRVHNREIDVPRLLKSMVVVKWKMYIKNLQAGV